MDILFIDWETGGLDPAQGAEGLEIAAMLLDGNTLEEKARYETGLMRVANPDNLHPKALETNGYTKEVIMTGRSPITAMNEFSNWLTRATKGKQVMPAGHNVEFDIAFTKDAFSKYVSNATYSTHFSHRKIDTQGLAWAELCFKRKLITSPALQTCLKALNIDPGKAHTAMSDVIAGVELLRYLLKGGN